MRSIRRSLGLKLQLATLAVAAVALLTMATAILVLGPSLFRGDPHIEHHALTDELQAAFRSTIAEAVLLAAAAAVLAAGATSILVARRVVQPLTALRSTAQRMAAGGYAQRATAAGGDEIADLAGALNELAAELELAEQRRRALLADIAHELRTPLATIDGYLEGVADCVVEPTPETVALLRRETARLSRLVDDVREVSHAESGQLLLEPRPMDPLQLVATAAAAARPAFDAKGVALEVDRGEAPAVLADPDRLEQVLANVLSNALRHTPAGGSVRVELEPAADVVRIRVSDTGEGIAADDLPHVFDRFFRADAARSREDGGSGIGLTVARALVEAQGGRITAASAGAGEGATFAIELPRAS